MESHLDKKAWESWLGKEDWTIAEAVALSVGIPPEAVEIERHTMPTLKMTEEVWNWLHTTDDQGSESEINFGQTKTDIPPMPDQSGKADIEYWTLKLNADHIKYGKTIESLLQKRAQDPLLGEMFGWNSGIKLDPTIPMFTPNGVIADMCYEEWELPSEMMGKKHAAPRSKKSGDEEPPKDIDAYLDSLENLIYLSNVKILLGIKDRDTIAKRWENGVIPVPRKVATSKTGGRYEWTKHEWVEYLKDLKKDPHHVFNPTKYNNIKNRAK
jgi:hypothetical protein